MLKTVGIRRETKDKTELRVPLTPEHIKELIKHNELNFLVQSAEQRKFTDEEFKQAGAIIKEDLSECDLILGVKEVPIEDLIPGKPYCFFSHTIKGQPYNMPLLKNILNKNITLMDYEMVKDDLGRRLIFFGRFAGYAGMIDSLWLLGRKFLSEGINTPFNEIMQANKYFNLEDAEKSITEVGNKIKKNGLPDEICPLITGFNGYGHVSKGAQTIYDLLPVVEIKAKDLISFFNEGKYSNKVVYKVEFKEVDIYERIDGKNEFDLQHFFKNGRDYKAKYEQYVPFLSMIVNGIYWEASYDKLLKKSFMKSLYSTGNKQRLKVIGDITCDIEGSMELTVKATKSDNPCYVYEPLTGKVIDGVNGNGPVVLAVDKLPAELPRQASESFGKALEPFVPLLANADYSLPFDKIELPEEFKRAVITHQGKLTPDFQYLDKFLEKY